MLSQSYRRIISPLPGGCRGARGINIDYYMKIFVSLITTPHLKGEGGHGGFFVKLFLKGCVGHLWPNSSGRRNRPRWRRGLRERTASLVLTYD
jgi:hypothetical protein